MPQSVETPLTNFRRFISAIMSASLVEETNLYRTQVTEVPLNVTEAEMEQCTGTSLWDLLKYPVKDATGKMGQGLQWSLM